MFRDIEHLIKNVITSDSNYRVEKDKIDSKYCNDVD